MECWLGGRAGGGARSVSYSRVEVLGRVERRRRFSLEQKLSVLAEASAPGAVISEVARRHGLLPAQVFKWRRLAALGVIGIPGARSCRRSSASRWQPTQGGAAAAVRPHAGAGCAGEDGTLAGAPDRGDRDRSRRWAVRAGRRRC